MPHTTLTFYHNPTAYEIASVHEEAITEMESLLSRHVYTLDDLKNRAEYLNNIRNFCIRHPGYHPLRLKTEVLSTKINSLLSEFKPIKMIATHNEMESSSHYIQCKQSTKLIFSFLTFPELVQAKKACKLWFVSANETVINPDNIITNNKTILNLSHLSKKPTFFQLNSAINNVLSSYWEKWKFWKSTQDQLGMALENMEKENKQKFTHCSHL